MSQKNTPKQQQASGPAAESVWEQIRTIGLAVLVALAIRSFVIEPFSIPSGSMFPTLLIGDHLFVNKFTYGIKLPFVDFRLPGLREPERGDVVVFTVGKNGNRVCPVDRCPSAAGARFYKEEFVKRIVGVPGDVVELRGEEIWINGEKLHAEDSGEVFIDNNGDRLLKLREQLGDKEHWILDHPRAKRPRRARFEVEEGRYLMMGDNRDNSNDSREWGRVDPRLATVRLNEMKGPAWILYWSWNYAGGWLQLLNPLTWWSTEKRWDRLGDRVE